MIRNIIILLNLFVVLIYNLLFGDGIVITQDFPEKIKPGETFQVTLTIEKGDISGFAKLQQDLPAGFTATQGETQGGSFTFSDGKIKFIWMSLPKDPTFTVNYTVTSSSTEGSYVMDGTFAYLEGNDKKTTNIASKTLVVHSGSLVQSNEEPANSGQETETTASANTGTEESNESSDSGSGGDNNEPVNRNQGESVTCMRKLDTSRLESDGEVIVTLTVNKGSVGGFAKLQETLPSGLTATAIEPGTSSFSFVEKQAKFLWMSVPSDDVIEVKYKITAEPGISGEFILNGDFSYLVDNETRKCVIDRESIIIPAPSSALAQDNTSTNENTQTETQDSQSTETTADNNTSANQTETSNATNTGRLDVNPAKNNNDGNAGRLAVNENKTNQDPAPKVPAASTGIHYKVQIAAARKAVGTEYFSKKFNISDPIAAEMHEGWNKYTVGGFNDYPTARNKRNETRNSHQKLIGPFVAAYNNGERITVQEALMISGQKWVK